MLYVIAALALLETPQAAEPRVADAGEILRESRECLSRIQTLDYKFTVDLYGSELQRFRAKGNFIRFDTRLPTARRGGGLFIGRRSNAFNGERYQVRHIEGRVMAHSANRRQDEGEFGPCHTPLEECYRWLRVVEVALDWEDLRDPEVWARLAPAREPLSETFNSRACRRLDFVNHLGVIISVYFSIEDHYFPVGYLVSKDRIGARTNVSDLIAIESDGETIPFPLAVTCSTAAHGAIPPRLHSFQIPADSIRINQPIGDNVFTLSRHGMDNITDIDTDRVYLPATGETLSFDGTVLERE